jgi:hypothetical protein
MLRFLSIARILNHLGSLLGAALVVQAISADPFEKGGKAQQSKRKCGKEKKCKT